MQNLILFPNFVNPLKTAAISCWGISVWFPIYSNLPSHLPIWGHIMKCGHMSGPNSCSLQPRVPFLLFRNKQQITSLMNTRKSFINLQLLSTQLFIKPTGKLKYVNRKPYRIFHWTKNTLLKLDMYNWWKNGIDFMNRDPL